MSFPPLRKINMTPTFDQDGASHSSEPLFEPMGLTALASLSKKTLASLAWDLAQAGDIARLRSMSSCIPFSNASGSLDAALSSLAFFVADAAWIEPLATQLEALLVAGKRQLHDSSNNRNDFGPLATVLAMEALFELLVNPQPPPADSARTKLGKSIRLARSPTLPISTYFNHSLRDLAYGFLTLPEPVAEFFGRECFRLGISTTYPTVIHPALALASRGEPALLDALLTRPEFIDKLDYSALAGRVGRDDRQSEFKILHSKLFWSQAAPLGLKLLDCARSRPGLSDLSLHDRVASAIVQSSSGDPCSLPLRQVLGTSGPDFFALLFDGLSLPAGELFSTAIALASKDDFFKPACARLMDKVFDMSTPIRNIESPARWHFLRSALFSPLPGVAEMAQSAWAKTQGIDSDPYLACLRSSNIERQIEAICHCGRPDLALRGLDAIGIEVAQKFPGHRKGLDASLGMWVAHKAPLHIFQAVVEWFDAHGGLGEQASAKAWVYQGHETRKKGDLLADCVARGSLDQARFLLARLPGADTKPAREVAKAMAAKVSGSAGGIALSAWESLLLGKVLQAHLEKAMPRATAEPAKRHHRL